MSVNRLFSSIRYPIFGAPMANVSGSAVAAAVSRAGGLGLIGGGYSTDKLRKDVMDAVETLKDEPYNIGFGVLTFSIKDQSIVHDILRDVEESGKVNSVWLFGGDEEKWIPGLKRDFPELVVMVQVHNVQAAQRMVECGADVIVAQGSDSGGHGGAESSSIISLVPEIVKSCPGVPVLAAGGISNGQGIFAALSLGAAGVVLGTRFMLSQESLLPQKAKEVACRAKDGGRTTVQTRLYDEMRGTTDWPMNFTGRAIRNKTIEESLTGREEAELKEAYKTAVGAEDYSRVVCWAGTGVGLVNDILPAAQIVTNLVKEYNEAVQKAPASWNV
ncbi:Nitronate monooxygenase [Taphrina deformans PYCC 5710]|uniref:Nitronate monooxygenase n=1 Tax=Taphrina deformans (strain PYCC 5710 / ATCC 11124 / CBS 356.35 / IMI 108563 / JCM 9778 / NBRC 8474) TaxID=1097556 RepID=R4X8N6_TAPDE|nr:Nitronate monooxygenase [Taphrina deformans PYCC 5710]|eukprot:CCG81993.1 Nitronate monooxygenase [Taphrina deformans PYCC 5710]